MTASTLARKFIAATTVGPQTPGSAKKSNLDRKSTRLNSSHGYISYAVFCLKKKKTSAPLAELREGARLVARHRTGPLIRPLLNYVPTRLHLSSAHRSAHLCAVHVLCPLRT